MDDVHTTHIIKKKSSGLSYSWKKKIEFVACVSAESIRGLKHMYMSTENSRENHAADTHWEKQCFCYIGVCRGQSNTSISTKTTQ
jgi:hypothetical protein